MTGHFVLTPRARADLDEIWDYTADRWGLDQAETYHPSALERYRGRSKAPVTWQRLLGSTAGLSQVSLRLACPVLSAHHGRR